MALDPNHSLVARDDTTSLILPGNSILASQVVPDVGDSLVIAEFSSVTGAPAASNISGDIPVWLFDAAAIEAIATYAKCPNWATMTAQFVWAPSTAGAGSVVWDAMFYVLGDGAAYALSATASVTSAASGVTNQLEITPASGAVAVPAGQLMGVRVRRNATSGADDYAADAKFLSVILAKAS